MTAADLENVMAVYHEDGLAAAGQYVPQLVQEIERLENQQEGLYAVSSQGVPGAAGRG